MLEAPEIPFDDTVSIFDRISVDKWKPQGDIRGVLHTGATPMTVTTKTPPARTLSFEWTFPGDGRTAFLVIASETPRKRLGPKVVRELYSVEVPVSGTDGDYEIKKPDGTVYGVEVRGGKAVACSCEAGICKKVCKHARAIENLISSDQIEAEVPASPAADADADPEPQDARSTEWHLWKQREDLRIVDRYHAATRGRRSEPAPF
jgi:hypothetical protein